MKISTGGRVEGGGDRLTWRRWVAVGLLSLTMAGYSGWAAEPPDGQPHWRRGNLHTHTLWSDGDHFPENVAQWYKERGYDFLVFTDHNTLLEGEKWKALPHDHQALGPYRELVGGESVQTRPDAKEGRVQVRLHPLAEFRARFEEPEKFLLVMGSEITSAHAVHALGLHLDRRLDTVSGSVDQRGRMIRDVVAVVDAYRAESGRNTHAVLAHPNWQWALTAEMMAAVENLRFFEVHNGHGGTNNGGNAQRAGTDRIWDIVLALRLSRGHGNLLFGAGTDDAHHYFGKGIAAPGRAWVMVDAPQLTAEAILDALDRGNFYATTGVTLRRVHRGEKKIEVEIAPREGEQYVTEYIGTRRGADLASTPALDAEGREIPNTTRVYGEAIGEVLHRTADLASSYAFAGDELYVRARITSTADHLDPTTGAALSGKQRAWVQPVAGD